TGVQTCALPIFFTLRKRFFLFFLKFLFIRRIAILAIGESIPGKLLKPFIFPLDILLIMSRICLNCLIILLTSTTGRPEPAAILRRRLGLSISGFSRSSGVIE